MTVPNATLAERLADPAAALERARRNADLNAFISLFPEDELAPAEATGPLAGEAVAVKDNIDVAGLPCTAGTPGLAEWRPQRDAAVVERLREAGGVVIGKTNLHELAAGITSGNPTHGAVRNPHDRELMAGGSSGGSAAAVGAAIVEVALGTDTAGSCRIPAAHCGCAGFRPTVGRYPLEGVLQLSSTRDVVGVIASTVAKVRATDSVLSGQPADASPSPEGLSGKRLGVPRPYFYEGLDSELAEVIETALAALEDVGAVLIETEVERLESIVVPISLPLILYESVRSLSTYLNTHRAPVHAWEVVEQIAGPFERGLLENELWGEPVSGEAYREIICEGRPALMDAYRSCFKHDGLDALVLPTTPLPARALGSEETVPLNGVEVPTLQTYLRNTDPSAIAGLPSISVPAGLTAAGLPVGISFDGLPGADPGLLGIANEAQDALNGGS